MKTKRNLESNEIPILERILRSPAVIACKISHVEIRIPKDKNYCTCENILSTCTVVILTLV